MRCSDLFVTLKFQIYVLWCGLMVASCGKTTAPEELTEIVFKGITSVQATSSPGTFVVTWKKAQVAPIDSYEIYLLDMSAGDANDVAQSAAEPVIVDDGGITNNFTDILVRDDARSPVVLGKLHSIVSADKNSFQIENVQPGTFMAQVRARSQDGRLDSNQNVIVFARSPDTEFKGLQLIEVKGNTAELSWLPWFGGTAEVQYQVFKGEAFNESLAVVKDTTFAFPLDGERPGDVIPFGVRVLFANGSTDQNTNLVSLTVPTDLNPFIGCLKAEPKGYDRVELTFEWPTSRTYERMDILRNGAKVFQTADTTLTTFLDKGLKEGNYYSYACQAVLGKEFKVGENQLRVQTLSSNPPTFEGAISAEFRRDHIYVRWGVAKGIPPTHFLVYGNAGTEVDWARDPLARTEPYELGYQLKEFGDDLGYSFGVRACAEDICDTNTQAVQLTVPDLGPPKTQAISEIVIDAGKFVITAPWTEVDGGIVKRYLYFAIASSAPVLLTGYKLAKTSTVTDVANPPTSFIVESLKEKTDYHFVVVDEDPQGNKTAKIAPFSIYSGDLSPPVFLGIKDLKKGASGSEDTSLEVLFDALNPIVTDPEGASSYYVYVREGEESACDLEKSILHSKIDATTIVKGEYAYIIKNLKPRTKYAVCVRAVDDYGNISTNSNFLVRQTLDLTPPEFNGVESFTYDKAKASLVASWGASPSEDLGTFTVNIWFVNRPEEPMLQISYSKADAATGLTFDASTVPFVSEDLVAIYVNACDDANTLPGGTANCTQFTQLDKSQVQLADVLPPPGFLGVAAESELTTPAEGQVVVKWLAPSDWSDYAGFNIYTADVAAQTLEFIKLCPCAQVGCPAQPTSCLVSGLDANRSYNFHVRAYDQSNNITQLDLVSSTLKTTTDTTAPSFSSNLQAQFADGSVSLSWNAATDNQYSTAENPAVINYSIYAKSTSTFADPLNPAGDGSLLTTTAEHEYNYSESLTGGVTYYYSVCAKDGSGNQRCDGNVRSVTVPDLVAPVIASFTSTKGDGDIEWQLNWSATDNSTATTSLFTRLYKQHSTSAIPNVTEQDTLIVAGPNKWSTATTPIHGSMNKNEYVHYLLVITDSDQNKSKQVITIESQNEVSVEKVRSTEGDLSGGDLVIVQGAGFHSNSKVFIGTSECTTSTYISPNFMSCVAPAQASGAYSVTVKKYFTDGADSSGTLSNAFSYCAPNSGCTQACLNTASWSGGSFASGDGSAASPYLICTEVHFANIAAVDRNKYFKLGANIDLAGSSLKNIVNSGRTDFRGEIAGEGFSILNFSPTVNANDTGLFKVIGQDSILQDFNLLAASIDASGYTTVGALAASIQGRAATVIKDIYLTGSVTDGQSHIGLLAGYVDATLASIRGNGTVSTNYYGGGLVGYARMWEGYWDQLYFDGTLQGLGETTDGRHNIGGIAGYLRAETRLTYSNLHANVTIKGTPLANRVSTVDSRHYGGLFGRAHRLNIKDCSVQGKMVVHRQSGGVVGVDDVSTKDDETVIENCSVDLEITNLESSGNQVGGFMGYNSYAGNIKNSSFRGSITLPEYTEVGGVVGYSHMYGADHSSVDDYMVLENVTADFTKVSAKSNVGGIVGQGIGVHIKGVTVLGDVVGTGNQLGLVAGQLRNASTIDSALDPTDSSQTVQTTASGDVTGGSSSLYVGGLVGEISVYNSGQQNQSIKNAAFSGNVVGQKNVGGILGRGAPALYNVRADANISGQERVGGIVGHLYLVHASVPEQPAGQGLTFIGDMVGSGANTGIGGLVGYWGSAPYVIKQGYAKVTMDGGINVGAIFGEATHAGATNSRLEEVLSEGVVKGTGFVGGIGGRNRYILVKDSYSLAAVEGSSTVGGIFGDSGKFTENVYAAGTVSATVAPVGGVSGSFTSSYPGPGDVHTYWDSAVTGQSNSAFGTGRSSAEMKTVANWSFLSTTIWVLEDDKYPALKWKVDADAN
ncbi:MAG: IPT/TIG domain-containing protein [Zetaproteobacteria bacterium]|nr:IPT/TIG domain-containing protein [Zetaproteobacteria bacterium]